jgi:uncharacterized protein YndB with AHSA1/START domain
MSIEQQVTFDALPQQVFDALTQAKQFSAFSGGAPADIDARAGGAFKCFGGMISGRNVELLPGRRLVQAWRAGNWEEGVYSIVRFELASEGQQTRLVFSQSGHPAAQEPHLAEGWPKMYWEPLARHLGARG